MSNIVISAEELRLLVKVVVAETILELKQATKETVKPRKHARPLDDTLNRRDAAEYIGVSYSTLRNWASTGDQEIPYYKPGREARYRREDLDAWLETQRVRHA